MQSVRHVVALSKRMHMSSKKKLESDMDITQYLSPTAITKFQGESLSRGIHGGVEKIFQFSTEIDFISKTIQDR